MAWYNPFEKKPVDVEEKLNPAQQFYGNDIQTSREPTFSYERAYEELEVVNRAVNIIVDDAAEIPTQVGAQHKGNSIIKGIKRSKVDLLLNREPNPFQDINTFKRNLIIDFILDGNIFIYYDGAHLYHLPADKMVIHASSDTYIEKFTYNEKVNYKPSEIIHIKENSFYSIYRGVPRLSPALRTMQLMMKMRKFQDNFFKNGAVPGLVLKSPNTLSEKIKERDFQNSIADNEKIILKALGVPPIMMDSGNNANIRPNMRMYYLETILPIVRKVNFACERYFGFELKEDISDIPALQPELRDASAYYTSLVNGGIITPAEAREKLGFAFVDGTEEIRVPANIAGSATNPDEGGRTEETNEDGE
jgi:phage portal protein BeeE